MPWPAHTGVTPEHLAAVKHLQVPATHIFALEGQSLLFRHSKHAPPIHQGVEPEQAVAVPHLHAFEVHVLLLPVQSLFTRQVTQEGEAATALQKLALSVQAAAVPHLQT